MIDPCLPGQLGTQKSPIDTQTLGLDDQGTYKQGLHCRLGWAKITKGLWSKVLINQPLFYSFHLTNASIMLRINKLHCCVFLFKIVVVVLVYVEKYLWDFFCLTIKNKTEIHVFLLCNHARKHCFIILNDRKYMWDHRFFWSVQLDLYFIFFKVFIQTISEGNQTLILNDMYHFFSVLCSGTHPQKKKKQKQIKNNTLWHI